MARIGILGSGGWGIALAMHGLSRKHDVVMWSPFAEEADALIKQRESRLLPGVKISEEIKITTDLGCVNGCEIVIIATPSFAVRETAARLRGIDCNVVVNVAKGFERGSFKRLSEVISEELGGKAPVILSGPSHAEEVARGVPTTLVAASEDAQAAAFVQKSLIGPSFRIYTNGDVTGVEIGGALKNVIAVAAGIENGLQVGDNTRAALMTRGLAEIARLGVAMGADVKTFMGLSGLGDLIVTCMSEHSRNNRFGNLVGRGVPVKEALERVGTVEGYYAVETAVRLAEKYKMEMPITHECYQILYQQKSPKEAILDLMTRPGRTEEEPVWL